MAKKRTLADLIRDEVEQQSPLNNDAYRDEPRPDWVMNSCSGATLKISAPEQLFVLEQPPIQSAPEQKHWVETYSPSKRKAYYYYRYVWMEGRLLKHKHLPGGNNSSPKAIAIKELVDRAIALGTSPAQIIALIATQK